MGMFLISINGLSFPGYGLEDPLPGPGGPVPPGSSRVPAHLIERGIQKIDGPEQFDFSLFEHDNKKPRTRDIVLGLGALLLRSS